MTGVKLTVTMKGTERNLCSGNSVIIFHILLFADAKVTTPVKIIFS